jgi:hypothetical protein
MPPSAAPIAPPSRRGQHGATIGWWRNGVTDPDRAGWFLLEARS